MTGRTWAALVVLLACLAGPGTLRPASGEEEPPRLIDLSKDKVLYAVAVSHLDTQWRWTIQNTIRGYLPATLRYNFQYFEDFPHYQLGWEGAFRYMLAREYYPEEYAALKECIAAGRWHVTGGALDSIDTNLPSPESLMRHVLYGNGFFKREFGRRSCDIFLTDSFGYGYALPSVAAHSGLGFFTTQKLTWGSAAGIPFDLGLWEGVDGSTVVAALNPGTYMTDIGEDLSVSREWLDRIEAGGRRTGIYAGYLFYGVGDRGGAPLAESVRWIEKSIAGTGPVRVVSATPDQLYRDLKPREIARLPRYRGELLLSTHGTGCYTSQAAMKRWNRKNELLADAAERAAVTADWLGAAPYPGAKLSEAWIRFLWHQFHDDLPGTCIPQAYTFSWNDEIVALNQFSEVLADSSGAIIRAMDTSTAGTAVVVYNPLSIEREDAVEAEVRYVAAAPRQVRVFDDDGDEMPSQVLAAGPESVRVLFLARVPPVGFRLYDVRPADGPCAVDAGLKVTEGSLENRRYLVRLGEDGDVVSIRDKAAGRELLSAPLRLALFDDRSIEWPAWEIQYSDITAKPRGYVGGPARVRIVEHGPARATLEVERQAGESRFVQRISLVAGRPDGDAASPGGRIEFDAAIAWESRGTLLKAEFPLAVANPLATYDLGLGAITRGNNSEKLYEVPAQQWADVTDPKNEYGVAILNDSKYGWDKPDDRTLRLTLLHTPATGDQSYVDQATQDIGRHRTRYAVCGHKGDWRAAVPWEAARLNQPLVAFQAPDHDGPLGRVFSMLRTSTRQVAVRALKGADDGDEVILRLQELRGEPAKAVRVSMAGGITAAREVNAAEEPIGPATVRNGDLITDLKPWQPRTFAVQIGPPPAVVSSPVCRPLDLPYDIDVVSLDSDRTDGDFDGSGHSLPGELLPARLVSEGIAFEFGPTGADARNAVIARGQTLPLPDGKWRRLYVLAAAVGHTRGLFTVGGKPVDVPMQDFTGFVGQWDSRVVDGRIVDPDHLVPAFIKRDPIAWVGTHRHGPDGKNEPYVFCYLFKYRIDLPEGTTSVVLPDNRRIRILAATAATDVNDDARPAALLYD